MNRHLPRARSHRPRRSPRRHALVLSGVALLASGCATIQEIANLRQVDFAISGLSGLRLAGVDLTEVRDADDLGMLDVGRITFALARDRMPLELTLEVAASNPATNGTRARLTELDWALFLEGRETVAGRIDREYLLEPGTTASIQVPIELDLLEFFEGNATELTELAVALAGGEASSRVALRATPTIDTPLGPMRYPQPILIERQVGGEP